MKRFWPRRPVTAAVELDSLDQARVNLEASLSAARPSTAAWASNGSDAEDPVPSPGLAFEDVDAMGKIRAGLSELLEQSDECGQGVAFWVEDYVRKVVANWRRDHPVTQLCARPCEGFCHSRGEREGVRPGFGGRVHDESSSRSGDEAATSSSGVTVEEPADRAAGVPLSPGDPVGLRVG